MFNNRLSLEEAKERMEQSMEEAETYRMHQRLGYSDGATARWIFLLVVVIVIGAAVLLY